MKLRAILSLILLTAIIGFGFISCKKDRTCKVLVIVQDINEEPPVIPVNVRLWCDINENPDCVIDCLATTLTDGTARFEFANPAILKVYVGTDPNPDNLTPKGYVELEVGEEVEKIITYP